MTTGAKPYRANRDGVIGVRAAEIEPGRSVPNDWNAALVERWADRKARRAAEREERKAFA